MLGRDAAPASVVHTDHVPGRHSGSLAGAFRPRPGPTAVKGESPDAAVARRGSRPYPADMVDAVGHGVARATNSGGPASNPGQAPLGAPYPSLGGTGKETGHPAPAPSQG